MSNRIPFPGASPHSGGLVLTDAEHDLITSAIGPCHGGRIEDFLAAAPVVPGGRYLDTNHRLIDGVLDAVGIEVRGYMKLDEERDGQERLTPKRGSTAARLAAIYKKIERHLS
jgi:hypothetical protein